MADPLVEGILERWHLRPEYALRESWVRERSTGRILTDIEQTTNCIVKNLEII